MSDSLLAQGFNRLAPLYKGLEYLLFGRSLKEARNLYLPYFEGAAVRRVLLLGDGDGRFLTQLLATNPEISVTSVDISPAMIRSARARVERRFGPIAEERVTWWLGDIREMDLPFHHYDLVVTHFFLDCFEEAEGRQVVDKIHASLRPDGFWHYADFYLPPDQPGLRLLRLRARIWLGLLYRAFRLLCHLPARQLAPYPRILRQRGLYRVKSAYTAYSLIISQLYQKISPGRFGAEGVKELDSPPPK